MQRTVALQGFLAETARSVAHISEYNTKSIFNVILINSIVITCNMLRSNVSNVFCLFI